MPERAISILVQRGVHPLRRLPESVIPLITSDTFLPTALANAADHYFLMGSGDAIDGISSVVGAFKEYFWSDIFIDPVLHCGLPIGRPRHFWIGTRARLMMLKGSVMR